MPAKKAKAAAPPAPAPKASNMFRKLLMTESSATLPTTDAALDALFIKYRVRPEAYSAPGVTRTQRQELAAAILWFHTHVHDPAPALDRLPFEGQELLAECFVQDFAADLQSDPNWRVRLSFFLKAATASGSTPVKRPRPGSVPAGSASQQVSKGVPSAAGPAPPAPSASSSSDSDSAGSAAGPTPPPAAKQRRRGGKRKKSKHSRRHRSSSSDSRSSSDSGSDAGGSPGAAAGPAGTRGPFPL